MINEKNGNENVCSHEICNCEVDADSSYSRDRCEEADNQDTTEIKCDCGHASCS